MAVVYGKFELPSKIKVVESTKNFAKFVAEPFEKGFGHTIGNALRRIMLTALEAPAIISVKIEGVPHEYMAIEGVIEDMTHIVLNLKGALLRKLPSDDEAGARRPRLISRVLDITQEMIDAGQGQYVVVLQDIMGDGPFEIVNPDMKVFTVTHLWCEKLMFE